ncbi:DinB family protein [Aquimarina gracilis]|uniref:DinB family protein n=1 Tax=Aquimarina gracilis TaxID=874422 RepID=A0ABU5ZU63_9FLAO|nr:DinB family protein [Aquimarina gracilis]MEB3345092.1 DinB family protein [Aquimarina gracilis]
MDFKADLVDTWNINNKVTLYLLDNIDPLWLLSKINGKGKSIGEQFVHINNMRSFWIGKVGEKIDLKIDKKHATNKQQLVEALSKSAQKMSETLHQIFEQGRIKGYKPHPIAFFSQIIAHESHHRGQIMATITRNNIEISKSVNFGLWNWNNK